MSIDQELNKVAAEVMEGRASLMESLLLATICELRVGLDSIKEVQTKTEHGIASHYELRLV